MPKTFPSIPARSLILALVILLLRGGSQPLTTTPEVVMEPDTPTAEFVPVVQKNAREIVIISYEEDGYAHLFTYIPDKVSLTRITYGDWDDITPSPSPDGEQIAFIKIPDTQTPFTAGELWVMDADGSHPRKLADADAGHGYAASWSLDGKWIAFVKRENIEDQNANQSTEALISNIYLVNLQNGELKQITFFENGRAETPHWSPDGNTLVFSTVLNGRMEVQIADIASGEIRSLTTEPACCPAWMRK